jgi:hypothetical protein
MDEKEIEEYKELSDKVDSNEVTFSELLRLNEFHVRFLRTSYHKLIENQEIQGELEESVELFKAAFEEAEAWNKVFTTFIEEQGLTDALSVFLDEAFNDAVREGLLPNIMN